MDTQFMNPNELLERMLDPAAPMPFMRDITTHLAMQLASVADKLTEEEIQGFVELGIVINQRTTKLVPFLGDVN
jgi:hypothetical protein